MDLTINGKQMNVGDALRTHVTEKLNDIDAKFFNRAFATVVTFAPEGHAFVKTHISLKVGKDIMVTATATEPDAYVSFDAAAAKIAKQLRKYKNRLRDHHERIEQTPESEMIKARDYTLASETLDSAGEPAEPEAETASDPLIVAEMPMQIQKMSVSEAVMRLGIGLPPRALDTDVAAEAEPEATAVQELVLHVGFLVPGGEAAIGRNIEVESADFGLRGRGDGNARDRHQQQGSEASFKRTHVILLSKN